MSQRVWCDLGQAGLLHGSGEPLFDRSNGEARPFDDVVGGSLVVQNTEKIVVPTPHQIANNTPVITPTVGPVVALFMFLPALDHLGTKNSN